MTRGRGTHPRSTPLTFAQASASSCSATHPRYFPSFFTF
ncbi:uncharacterized protein G2W53_026263 [Senna tora]|uniref:Uncharacterized protein n=1 Tax=Senna tora TaxID=362788 RepID=A0A834TEV7_9FABA|nr:uncharacterized protein G2W53_026263 [Senna tora]